jgi:hypothetical protein
MALVALVSRGADAAERAGGAFLERVQPVLEEYCSACHANGAKKGGVSFDGLAEDGTRRHDPKLWWAVLKNVRAGLMPPAGKPRPSDDERRILEGWIKSEAFGIDANAPDPGRVVVRRLNRVEYRNTIRDLLGVDFDTNAEFPPDDTGHGFDNIGEVLTISPMLLEKYIAAAKTIVARAVPMSSKVVAEKAIPGRRFHEAGSSGDGEGPLSLSYYEPASVSCSVPAEHAGRYRLVVELTGTEKFVDNVFDYNKCRLIFKADGEELSRQEFARQEGRTSRFEFDRDWGAGPHELTFELEPLTPSEKQVRSLAIRINAVTVKGPFDEQYWTKPPDYDRYFPGGVPEGAVDRRRYARERLAGFATKAFRRPVDEAMADRLSAFAEAQYTREGRTFEAGVAQAMAAVLASPRFLFREEGVEPGSSGRYPLVDEYALASRLSYFLWSSMPDDELFELARRHKLRENLSAQVKRMLADPKSARFMRDFVGQWLQARDIDSVLVNAFAVISGDQAPDPEAEKRRARFRELRRKPPEELTEAEKAELKEMSETFFRSFRRFREFDLNGELRRAMRRETEMAFEHVVREDRPLAELLDADYTFLNERLAKHYGIPGVNGDEMRLVKLPPDSPRGGVLTQGTVLAVTSNPDRTSPVKRGLFILDNLLGTPPPPPPPDIPALEDARKAFAGRTPTLRETLEVHRKEASCSACHNRMDPLGLALENFNALGMWREKERGGPIEPSGKLITGEAFSGVRELKRILAGDHRRDVYRCLSEKMLTYALGRGLDYYDVQAVDELVARIEKDGGRASALLMGIIESVPFQRRRRPDADGPLGRAGQGAGAGPTQQHTSN